MKSLLIGVLAAGLAFSAQAGESVTYKVDGKDYEGYMAKASGTSKGLVLIVHDWDGVDKYEETRAEMLAMLGYDAFAVDLFGKGNRPQEVKAKRALTGSLYKNRDLMRKLMVGGLETARKSSSGKAVVMGYCFGGAAVLEMARSIKASDIAGYATFHGGLSTPKGQSYPDGTAPILVAHGGADTAITMDHVAALSKELEAKKIKYQIEVYSGAPHAFTVIGSGRYRKVADEQSWSAFRDFLNTNLPGS